MLFFKYISFYWKKNNEVKWETPWQQLVQESLENIPCLVLSLRERVDRRTKLHEHIKGLKKIFFRPPGWEIFASPASAETGVLLFLFPK